MSMLKRHLDPSRMFVNQVIDIELAYVNTNHPDFISMDDVFTERANHSSQAEMYKQIGNTSDEEEFNGQRQQRQQYQNKQQQQNYNQKQQQQKQKQNPNSHPLNNNDYNNQRIKSAPAPPQNNNGQPNGGGGKGWFGFGRGGNPNSKQQQNVNNNNMKDTNPFNEPQQSSNISSSQQQQRQKREQQQRRKKSNLATSQQRRSSKPSSFNSNDSLYPSKNLSNATQREQLELLVIKRFIRSYFGIVKKNIADLVPKSIMFMLVNKSKSRLQQDLALTLYKEDQFEQLLSESPEIARKRKAAKDLLSILRKALQIINEVNDYRIESKSAFE